MKYVIGVEGSNDRTEYFLFNDRGEYIDYLVDGTCNHEAVGFDGAQMILKTRIRQLLTRNRLGPLDVAAGAFGMAGIDTSAQQEQLESCLQEIGLEKYVVANDSMLGVICGTSEGVGVCSVNSMACITGGIDRQGMQLQVGGMGEVTGDDGGGGYIADMGVRKVYDSFFRCGEKTAMSAPMFSLLGISSPEQIMQALYERADVLHSKEMVRIVFAAAGLGDAPAVSILEHVGREMALSTAGLVQCMDFGGEVEIVLSGEIWHAESMIPYDAYVKQLQSLCGDRTFRFAQLTVPTVLGAVMWALSLSGMDIYNSDRLPCIKEAVLRHAANTCM